MLSSCTFEPLLNVVVRLLLFTLEDEEVAMLESKLFGFRIFGLALLARLSNDVELCFCCMGSVSIVSVMIVDSFRFRLVSLLLLLLLLLPILESGSAGSCSDVLDEVFVEIKFTF